MTEPQPVTPERIAESVDAGLRRLAIRRTLDGSAVGLLLGGLAGASLKIGGLLSPVPAFALGLFATVAGGGVGYRIVKLQSQRRDVRRSALKAIDDQIKGHDALLTVATVKSGPFPQLVAMQVASALSKVGAEEWVPPRRRRSPWLMVAGLLALIAAAIVEPLELFGPAHIPSGADSGSHGPTAGISGNAAIPLEDGKLAPVLPGTEMAGGSTNGGESPADQGRTGDSDSPTSSNGESPAGAAGATGEPVRTAVPTTLRPMPGGDQSAPVTTEQTERTAVPKPMHLPWERPGEVPGVATPDRIGPRPATPEMPEVGERRRPPLRIPAPGQTPGDPREIKEEPLRILPEVSGGDYKTVPVERNVYRPGSREVDGPGGTGDGTGGRGGVAPMPERQPMARGGLSEAELRWLAEWRARFPSRRAE